METKAIISEVFNRNREANMKAILSCGYSATDKAAYAKAAMTWMMSDEGLKEGKRINSYRSDLSLMSNDQMIEWCESASAEVMDTFCPAEAAAAAREGAAWENDRFGKRTNRGMNAWNH